jgi:predicted TIM-barrel fold metal-dependent hydrolase
MFSKQENQTHRSQGCGCCASRRTILTGFAAMAASSLLPAPARAQAPVRKLTRIDVHRHFVPPGYVVDRTRTWLNDRSTIAQQLEDMDNNGVALAVISVSVPDLEARDSAEARRFSRLAHEFCAKLIADNPGRFGSFAYLPFPDVDGTLKEIEYALDTLKADGVYLRTNYNDKFLGDPVFAPVFEELNPHGAVLYTHPTSHPLRAHRAGLRDADIEYGTNTRAPSPRWCSPAPSRRYPNMKVIWSHAGGTMPFLVRRFIKRVHESPEYQPILPEGFLPERASSITTARQGPDAPAMAPLKASCRSRRSCSAPTGRI